MSEITPKKLADAVLELASAICPHNMDRPQRDRIRDAINVLVDEILAQANRRETSNGK